MSIAAGNMLKRGEIYRGKAIFYTRILTFNRVGGILKKTKSSVRYGCCRGRKGENMHCPVCGEKLALFLHNQEGLVPFCKHCEEFRFPQFATAVSMVVVNRAHDKILLARHKGQQDYILFAGYVKKGETAEKTVTREFREETKLNVVKYKYMSSRYHEPHNVLMLNFLVVAENGELSLDLSELDDAVWFDFDGALQAIRKGSDAEAFLKNAIAELKKQ